jgi:hypothetical protein
MTDTGTVPRQPDREPMPKRLVDDQLADELLGRAQAEGVELLGPDGLLSQVTKAVLERALGEEMTHHLGYEKHDPAGRGSGNSRNGSSASLSPVGEAIVTRPGAATGADSCSGAGAVSWPRRSSRRASRAFSARNRSTSRRRPANSSTGPSSSIGPNTPKQGPLSSADAIEAERDARSHDRRGHRRRP